MANRDKFVQKFTKRNDYFDDAQQYQKDKKRLKKDKRKDNGKRQFLDKDDEHESR